MIYLPIELTNNNCAYIYDHNTIRVYNQIPRSPGDYSYTDYFLDQHYLSRVGSTTYGSYGANYPTCINKSSFTTDYWYREDISSIVLTFTCIFIVFCIVVGFLLKTFRRGIFS